MDQSIPRSGWRGLPFSSRLYQRQIERFILDDRLQVFMIKCMVCGGRATGRRDVSHGYNAKVKSILICDKEDMDIIKEIAKYGCPDNVLQSYKTLSEHVKKTYKEMSDEYEKYLKSL